jgi:hypothetical protein
MPQEWQRDRLYGTAANPQPDRRPLAPRQSGSGAHGDSDEVKRYRQFFETHDLRGLPHRQKQAAQ